MWGGGGLSHSLAVENFCQLQGLLARLGLQEATHKPTPPATSMIWLGLIFGREAMTVTLPPAKLQEILELVTAWTSRHNAIFRFSWANSFMLLRFAPGSSFLKLHA